MRRVLLTAVALTIPVSVVALSVSGPAWAKTKPEHSISCRTLGGTISTTISISNCKGNVGGGASGLNPTALATGGTINWNNNTSTSIAQPSLTTITSKKCKAAGDIAESVSATVLTDTTGLVSLGTLTVQVCVDSSGNLSAIKPLKIT